MRRVEVFYDVVSPYSYFAVATLNRYAKKKGVAVSLRPFFLGGIMQIAGNKPPATVPKKGSYLFKDINRCAKYFEIGPFQVPSAYVCFLSSSF